MTDQALLSIDSARELDRLTRDRLHGPWQVVTDLVRWAVAHGASSVALEIFRRRARVVATGVGAAASLTRAVRCAARADGSDDERHAALLELETRGELAFLSAALAARAAWDEGGDSTTIDLTGLAWDAPHSEAAVADACRFCPIPVTVNGRRVDGGFDRALATRTLSSPIPAVVAIVRGGATPRLYLCVHGVVATRATLPGVPCFHAAVEMASLCRWHDNGAALREALGLHTGALIGAAMELLAEQSLALASMDPEDAARVRQLCLEACVASLAPAAMDESPLVDALDGDGRPMAALSLSWLRRHLDGRTSRRLLAVDDRADARCYLLLDPPILRAGATLRGPLSRLLEASLVSPPPAARRDRLRFRLRRFRSDVAELVRGARRSSAGLPTDPDRDPPADRLG